MALYFFIAGLAAWVLLNALLRTPWIKLFLDTPDRRKMHQRLVPRVGGLGVIVASLLVLAADGRNFEGWVLYAGGGLLLLIGLLDDSSLPYYAGRALSRQVNTPRGKHRMCRFELKVRYKLLLEVALCIAAVYALDLGSSPLRFGGESWDIGALGFGLSCFWLLGVMNAFNLIDGIDGLCGGTALLSLASVAGVGWMLGLPSVAMVAMAVAGAVLGFMYYNVSPARIFMGDMGSLFLGFVIGVLGLTLLKVPGAQENSLLPVVLAGLPVWDTCMAIARRYVDVPSGSTIGTRLKRIVGPDSNHIHHRMLYLGLSHWKASLVLYTHHALLLSSGWLLVVVPQEMQKWVLLYWLGNGALLFLISYQMRRLRIWAKRLWLMLQGMNELPWRVGVVCASAELNDSLACQRRLPFEFFHVDRVSLAHIPSVGLHAVLVEQLPGESVEELLDFAVNFQTAWDMPMALVMASHEHSADYVKEHPHWKELKHKVAVFNRPLYLWPLLMELLELLEKYHVARPTRSGERLAHTGNGAV